MEKRSKGKFLPDEIVEAVLEHEEWAENIVLDHYFDRAFDRVSRYMKKKGFGHDFYSIEAITWDVLNELADALDETFGVFYLKHIG